MTAETLVRLIEELIELKVQQHVGLNPGLPPDVARLVHLKRDSDRQRLSQLRAQLVKAIETGS